MPYLKDGVSILWEHKVLSGTFDGFGSEETSVESVTIDGCAVSQGNGFENTDATDQVEGDIIFHVPYGTGVSYLDQIVYNGVTYEVTGIPKSWKSPFTGTLSMDEITAKVVEGGGS